MADQPKVWGEVFLGEPDAPIHYKINKFTNLIPVEVEYEENGERKTALGYMDYATQNVKFTDAQFTDEGMFREAVLSFLMQRNQRYADSFVTPKAPEVDLSGVTAATNKQYKVPERGANKEADGTTAS